MKNKPYSIFLVTGSTGEYSDRMEWPVFAFLDIDEAFEYKNTLNDLAKKVLDVRYDTETSEMVDWDENPACQELLRYDPCASCMDYTGNFYNMEEVKLYDKE